MCGILGFFDTRPSADREKIRQTGDHMVKSLRHRGPDDNGIWLAPDSPLLLGHCRLSILDLSKAGKQPKPSPSGRYIISYNGEVYNYQELQKDLESAGIAFEGRSDTEVMLAAFDHWGVNAALQKFIGMFAFALWDRQTKTLHLVRDRMGQKPLYVGWAGETLVFGSELKTFHSFPGFKPEIDRQALAFYMQYGCMPAPHSIYKNIWQLLPGTRLTLRTENLSPGADLSQNFEPYWHLPRIVEDAKRKPVKNEKTATDEFEHLLSESVHARMISDVPLGAFLSGGLDSSAVVTFMQKQSPRPVKTFTIGFKESGFDEAVHARALANHLQTEHHEHYLHADEALSTIPRLPEIYDEPFADESQIPTILVSEFARKHVTVALSGDGGDEMLGGYTRHSAIPALRKRMKYLPAPARKAFAKLIYSRSADEWSNKVKNVPRFGEKLYKAANLLPYKSLNDAYRHARARWETGSGLVLNTQAAAERLSSPAWKVQGLNEAERLIYNDMLTYLPDDVLTKVDRASMSVSLEARAPLLDHRIAEYVWRLPLSMKIRDNQGKWLLRQVMHRHLPEQMLDRPKQGFSVPLAAWLSGPLKSWAAELLDEEKIRAQGYLNAPLVTRTWHDFNEGQSHLAYKLWTVLMFQAWLERWG